MEKNLKEWIQEQVQLFRIRTRALPERELYSLRTESSMLAAIRAYPVQALGRLDKNSLTPRAWAALASKSPVILEQYANIPAEAQVAVVKAVPSALRHLSARSIVTEQAYIEAVRREPSLIGLVRNRLNHPAAPSSWQPSAVTHPPSVCLRTPSNRKSS